MVVSKRAALVRAAQRKGGDAGRGAVWAEQSGGVGAIAQTFKTDAQQRISLMELMTRIRTAGIGPDDPRVREIVAELADGNSHDGGGLTMQQFSAVCEASGGLIARALRGDLAVPDFARLESEFADMYTGVRADDGGAVADYIPQLRRVDPEKFGIAVCTVDGQRFSIGDTTDLFCVQSLCKPINYSLAVEEHGAAAVHRHVGREPSGRGFNELSLTDEGLPHNPMIGCSRIMRRRRGVFSPTSRRSSSRLAISGSWWTRASGTTSRDGARRSSTC